MVGPAQSSDSETSPPNLSPSSSSSRSPKTAIDNLCSHIADTTLTNGNIQPNHLPVMQSQNISNPVQVRPPTTPLFPSPPSAFSSTAIPDGDHPMQLCESDVVGGLLSEEECKTPRGEEYRIPEPLTCPPAPKRSRRHWSERPACVGKEEEQVEEEEGEESVNSSDVKDAFKKMR